jgi:hypothetical protein
VIRSHPEKCPQRTLAVDPLGDVRNSISALAL